MCHRYTQFAGSDGTGHGRSYIPNHQTEVATLLQQHLFIAHHDVGSLLRLRARAYLQVDVGFWNAELLEKIPGHGPVVMLASVDQAVAKVTATRLGSLQGVDNRCDLH